MKRWCPECKRLAGVFGKRNPAYVSHGGVDQQFCPNSRKPVAPLDLLAILNDPLNCPNPVARWAEEQAKDTEK